MTFREALTEETAEYKRRLGSSARSAFYWLASTTVLWQAISWVVTLLTARILARGDYGVIAAVETFFPYFGMMVTLNMSNWIVQRATFSKDDERAMFTLTLVLGALMACVTYLSAPFISWFYSDPRLQSPVELLSFNFLFIGFYVVPEALLRRSLRFKPIALMNLSVGVSRGILQLFLAMHGFGYWSLVIGLFYKELTSAVWLTLAWGFPRGVRWDGNVYKLALEYGIPATGSYLFWVIFSTADYVVVGRLFGTEMLGTYYLAFYLTDLPMSKLNAVVRPVLMPYFSRLRHLPDQLYVSFLRMVRALTAISFPILVGLAAVAHEAIPVLLGEKWKSLVVPLQVMCAVGVIRAFTDNISPLILALGVPKKNLLYNAANAIIMPPCFYFLGKALGITGIYVAWVFVFPVVSFLAVLVLRDLTGISPVKYIRNLRAPVVGCTIMALVCVVLGDRLRPSIADTWLLVAEVSLGVIVYCGSLWLFFRNDTLEALGITKTVRSAG